MFEIFKKYVGLNDGVISNSPEEFLSSVEGKTFLNGMYRVFNLSEIEKWCKIVVHTFPAYKGQIKVFAYDWLGRIFAVKKLQGTVLMFEPGTGEVFDIPVTIEDFHNVEIVELEAAQVARVTGETAYVVLNGNYALEAGFSVGKDALAYEKSDSEAAKTYVNVVVVKEGNEDNEGVKALVDVLKSDEIKNFINEKYDGAVIPFEE